MTSTRTIYRCKYALKREFGSARASKAFQTEQETRALAEALKARGYAVIVWRELQLKWESAGKRTLMTTSRSRIELLPVGQENSVHKSGYKRQ